MSEETGGRRGRSSAVAMASPRRLASPAWVGPKDAARSVVHAHGPWPRGRTRDRHAATSIGILLGITTLLSFSGCGGLRVAALTVEDGVDGRRPADANQVFVVATVAPGSAVGAFASDEFSLRDAAGNEYPAAGGCMVKDMMCSVGGLMKFERVSKDEQRSILFVVPRTKAQDVRQLVFRGRQTTVPAPAQQ